MLAILLAVDRRRCLVISICLPTCLFIYYQICVMRRSEQDISHLKSVHFAVNRKKQQESEKEILNLLHVKVQQAIEQLQEPIDGCNGTSKVLVCKNNHGQAGFGSIVHRYTPCLQIAFGLGRVAVWNHEEYSHFGGYSRWMKPPTKACAHLRHKKFSRKVEQRYNVENRQLWNENFTELTTDAKYLFMGSRLSFPYPRYVPGTIPGYLRDALSELGVDRPWLWFYGQFVYYLIGRPNSYFSNLFKDAKRILNYTHPCIGVHIRQDPEKVSKESKFVATKRYSKIAVRLYRKNMRDVVEKMVYVASDIKSNFQTMKNLLPKQFRVTFLTKKYQELDMNGYFERNFNPDILESILLDIYFLWESDYVICMHSSNICRLIEELKYATTAFLDKQLVYSLHRQYYCDFPRYGTQYEYFATIQDKPKSCKKCMNYSQGFLFAKRQSMPTSTTDEFIELTLVNSVSEKGLIRKEDLMAWPGEPLYQTIIDLM